MAAPITRNRPEQDAPGACLVQHRYHASGREFFIVVCERCGIALNSGHHYAGGNDVHALRLAACHNVEHHDGAAVWHV